MKTKVHQISKTTCLYCGKIATDSMEIDESGRCIDCEIKSLRYEQAEIGYTEFVQNAICDLSNHFQLEKFK